MNAPAAGRSIEVSIVIPCYNEIENVAAIVAAVQGEARVHAESHEIILIDNCSTDGTREAIRALCAANPDVCAIFNNRNYGQMRSPTYGMYQARGRAVIGMGADFQDPPEMIGSFLKLWRGGAAIVLAQRRTERSSPLLGLVRHAGYSVLGRISDSPLVPGATGFGLFDHKVVETLAGWNEPEPFFRGMVVESGFPLALLPFDRPARAGGRTKNGIRALTAFALSALAGTARGMLRWPVLLSAWTGLASLVLLAFALFYRAWPLAAAGLAGTMFTVVLFFLGLIGDQVRLIAERTRGTPLVIEECRINFPEAPSP